MKKLVLLLLVLMLCLAVAAMANSPTTTAPTSAKVMAATNTMAVPDTSPPRHDAVVAAPPFAGTYLTTTAPTSAHFTLATATMAASRGSTTFVAITDAHLTAPLAPDKMALTISTGADTSTAPLLAVYDFLNSCSHLYFFLVL